MRPSTKTKPFLCKLVWDRSAKCEWLGWLAKVSEPLVSISETKFKGQTNMTCPEQLTEDYGTCITRRSTRHLNCGVSSVLVVIVQSISLTRRWSTYKNESYKAMLVLLDWWQLAKSYLCLVLALDKTAVKDVSLGLQNINREHFWSRSGTKAVTRYLLVEI